MQFSAGRATIATMGLLLAGVLGILVWGAPQSPWSQSPALAGGANASAVCGNGIVETGEQCDPADTPSGCDECDGCAADCTMTEECGLPWCEDGIDNDGNGLTDSLDPQCTTLTELQNLAIVASSTTHRSLLAHTKVNEVEGIDGNASITEPFPFGNSKAEVCARRMRVRGGSRLEGSLTITDEPIFSISRLRSGIEDFFVSATGNLPVMPRTRPWVGEPVGMCPDSSPCLITFDCGPFGRTPCLDRLELTTDNPMVDLDGSGAGADLLDRCQLALSIMDDLATAVDSIPQQASGDVLRIGPRQSQTLNVGPGIDVREFRRITLEQDSILTLSGSPDTVLVMQMNPQLIRGRLRGGRLYVGRRAQVVLEGGLEPRNILWNLPGEGRNVGMRLSSELSGTILAPGRNRVFMGVNSTLNGSMFAIRTINRGDSVVNHVPFTSLLPTDLEIEKTEDPAPQNPRVPVGTVVAGENLQYDITVTNNGFAWAPAVTVTDTLDGGVEFVSANPSQGTCVHDGSASGGDVTCFLGSLEEEDNAPANQATITITVRVLPDTRGSVTNQASVKAETAELDPGDNDTGPITTPVLGVADLEMAKSVDSPTEDFRAGRTGSVRYTLTITNHGPSDAIEGGGVSITDNLPDNVTIESITHNPASGSAANCPQSDPINCDLGTMDAGETDTVVIVVTPDCDARNTITNTASASTGGEINLDDSDTPSDATNDDSVDATLTDDVDLSGISKAVDPANNRGGGADLEEGVDSLTYTITVPNDASYSCTIDATVNDTIDSDLTNVSVTSSQGGCSSFPCNLGQIDAGNSATITVNADVAAGSATTNDGSFDEITNQASVDASNDNQGVQTSNTVTSDAELNLGDSCTLDTDCHSQHCVDGVCCDTGCDSTCESCLASQTGGTDGTCAAVTPDGTDPNTCGDPAAGDGCATDNCACNGSTGAGSCLGVTGFGTCSADGECLSDECADGVCCDADCSGTCESCLASQTGGSDGACAPVSSGGTDPNTCGDPAAGDGCVTDDCVCDGSGSCLGVTGSGACSADGECLSDECADGVCCDADCSGDCDSCLAADTASPDGTCAPIDSIAEDTSPTDLCSGSGAGCSGTDCICEAGTSTCKLDLGQTCSADGDCASGHCADGVCCNNACDGTCEACTAALTGGTDGTCAAIPAGTDPDADCPTCQECNGSGGDTVSGTCVNTASNTDPLDDCSTCQVCNGSGACTNAANGTDPVSDCPDDGAASCDRDGFCDGAGSCRLYASGTICQSASCSGLSLTRADTCDGSGTCVDNGTANCNDSNVCTNDSCSAAGLGSCSNTNNTNACDDGLFCTVNDTCSGGACSNTTARNCNDSNECTDDSCNEGTNQCDNINNSNSCNGGNGLCVSGSCTPCGDFGEICCSGSSCNSQLFCSSGTCDCSAQNFTFSINSNTGGSLDSAEWPGGSQNHTFTTGCSVTIRNPSGNIDLVGLLGDNFGVTGFSGFSNCFGTGREDGDGCAVTSCPPAGIGSCEATRPSCSAALNGSGSAEYSVQCNP